jgi:hypothetical protein
MADDNERLLRLKIRAEIKRTTAISSIWAVHALARRTAIESQTRLTIQVWILLSITDNLPRLALPESIWERLSNLALADPDFRVSFPIDVLFSRLAAHQKSKTVLVIVRLKSYSYYLVTIKISSNGEEVISSILRSLLLDINNNVGSSFK